MIILCSRVISHVPFLQDLYGHSSSVESEGNFQEHRLQVSFQ